jgi:beta-glucosidase
MVIGTNNAAHRRENPQHTLIGIKATPARLRDKLPSAHILLFAIFRRGQHKDDPLRRMTSKTNKLIKPPADHTQNHRLDINQLLLNDQEELTKGVANDYLHINENQYVIWANAMLKPLSN